MNNKKTIISIHAPLPLKPRTKEEFGYFLAGLIDADGHIAGPGYVQIDFNVREIGVAYYIKKCIAYGNISQERKRLSVRYRCTDKKGLEKIADLIRHKLKHDNKICQFNIRLAPLLKNKSKTHFVQENLLDNHWCAGFIQGDGCLSLILGHQKNKSFKPTMFIEISQKKPNLLKLLQNTFGGNVGYRKDQDTYYYISNSFTNAAKFIKYLDKYQLLSNKLAQYWVWRRAYVLYQENTHLTNDGQYKFVKLKECLLKFRLAKVAHLSVSELRYREEAKITRAKKRKLKAKVQSE